MTRPDLQRWSREVAEDPGAPSFVRLARAYRRQGRRPAALNVVLRGLERNPQNVDAHALLALLHVDSGDRLRAGDEWETILRLDPHNFDAHRGLGFLALEREDLDVARRHLEAAASARPDDPAVRQAREVLERRQRPAGNARPAVPDAPADAALADAAPAGAEKPATIRDGPRGEGDRDPSRLFDDLAGDRPFLGALVLDARGLVLAGSVAGDGRAELMGAMLDSAVGEARRAVGLLGLGSWAGLFLECDHASLYLAPVEGETLLLVAVTSDAPVGWAVRAAARAREMAKRFMESQR